MILLSMDLISVLPYACFAFIRFNMIWILNFFFTGMHQINFNLQTAVVVHFDNIVQMRVWWHAPVLACFTVMSSVFIYIVQREREREMQKLSCKFDISCSYDDGPHSPSCMLDEFVKNAVLFSKMQMLLFIVRTWMFMLIVLFFGCFFCCLLF